jgi:5-methylcytosine-specific restriction endonuclease McrA
MLNSNVLVLNRSYLPVHVTTARRAFSLIFSGSALAVSCDYETFDFDAWVRREPDRSATEEVGTPSGRIRVPRVIVLKHFDRVPRRHVRYSRLNIFARDKFTCQYCGRKPARSELNLDHVIPRSLGGRTNWENVVASCVDCNRRKGGRTPTQARLRLLRQPMRPRWTPLVHHAATAQRYEEWQPFLHVVDGRAAGQRRAAGGE